MTIKPPRKSKSMQVAQSVAKHFESVLARQFACVLSPAVDLKKIAGLTIQVWPMNRALEWQNRSTSRAEYEIAVAVLDRLEPNDDEDIKGDEVLELAETISDDLLGEMIVVDDGLALAVIATDHQPLIERERLESMRLIAAGVLLSLTRTEPIKARET